MSRVGGVEEIIAGGKTLFRTRMCWGGPTDRWGGAVCLSQPGGSPTRPSPLRIDTNGGAGRAQRERAESSGTGQISIYWRKADMRVTADACYGIEKCAALFDALFNGFRSRVYRADRRLDGRLRQRLGHRLATRCAEGNGHQPLWERVARVRRGQRRRVAVGTGPNTQNGTYTSLPSEWQAWAQNKSANSGYLGVT